MKKLAAVCVFLCVAIGFSQNKGSIRGSVTDKVMGNEPLLMANVQVKGDNTQIQTNFNGNYEISDLESGKYVVLVSYLGYETQEIPVVVKENAIAVVDVQLTPMQISFGDVDGIDSALKEVIKE